MFDSAKNFLSDHKWKIISAVVAIVVVLIVVVLSEKKIVYQVAYVKMDITDDRLTNRHLHLREVEFYDENGDKIVPIGCELSTVHNGSQESNCKALQDGILSTYWHSKYSKAIPSTEGGNTHFVKFTLPINQMLKTMVVVSRFNNTSRYGMAYVEYEVDGVIAKKYASLDGELVKSGTPDEGNMYRYVF
jgi:hypothetical protein